MSKNGSACMAAAAAGNFILVLLLHPPVDRHRAKSRLFVLLLRRLKGKHVHLSLRYAIHGLFLLLHTIAYLVGQLGSQEGRLAGRQAG
jgi:hypothetical protein